MNVAFTSGIKCTTVSRMDWFQRDRVVENEVFAARIEMGTGTRVNEASVASIR